MPFLIGFYIGQIVVSLIVLLLNLTIRIIIGLIRVIPYIAKAIWWILKKLWIGYKWLCRLIDKHFENRMRWADNVMAQAKEPERTIVITINKYGNQ